MKGAHNIGIIVLLHILSIHFVYAQKHDLVPELDLRNDGKTIENVIEVFVSTNEYRRIKEISGNKITLRKPEAVFNGKRIAVTDLHTRGHTTLHYTRKNFSISLAEKANFIHANDTMISFQ